jgi:hypothetical protein
MGIYFDLCLYETIVSSFHHDIKESVLGHHALKMLYRFIIKSYEDGIIGPKKLAYDISATGLYEIAKMEPFNEIITEATELKIPNRHINGDTQKRVENLVDKLKKNVF